jgi:hypothetical protein
MSEMTSQTTSGEAAMSSSPLAVDGALRLISTTPPKGFLFTG